MRRAPDHKKSGSLALHWSLVNAQDLVLFADNHAYWFVSNPRFTQSFCAMGILPNNPKHGSWVQNYSGKMGKCAQSSLFNKAGFCFDVHVDIENDILNCTDIFLPRCLSNPSSALTCCASCNCWIDNISIENSSLFLLERIS